MKKLLNDKRFNAFLILILLVIIVAIFMLFFQKDEVKNDNKDLKNEEQEKVSITFNEDVVFEFEEEFSLNKIISNVDSLKDNYNIKFFNTSTLEEVDILVAKYFDKDGKEVKKEVAVTNTEGVDTLNEGYSSKECIGKIGDYKIIITDGNGDNHETVISIKDIVAPTLALKNVKITEGGKVTVNSFVKNCTDNYDAKCNIYMVDSNDKETKTIPTKVGNHTIRIVAKDSSGNVSKIKEAKLTIDKKATSTSGSTSEGTGNTSGSSGSGSNSSGSTGSGSTNTSGYDKSNPIVARALSYVGKQGYICTEIAEFALNAVGKTLEVKEKTWRNKITHKTVSKSEAFKNHTYEVDRPFWYDNDNQDLYAHITLKRTVSNNIITESEVVKCYTKSLSDCSNFYDDSIGSAAYEEFAYSTWIEANIKKIGTQVSLSNIKPGDFLFYDDGGNNTTHIAVYIGNSMAVHGGVGNGTTKNNVMILSAYPKGASTPTAWRVNY